MTMMIDVTLAAEATAVNGILEEKGLMVATAESCTGGLVAATLTNGTGASAVVDRGFVTYSNEAKTDLLGVPANLIERVGAVSKEVAIAMAEGALSRSRADVAVSVTGIAGPTGGSPGKPIGLVHFAVARKGKSPRHIMRRFGDLGRERIRLAAVREALALLKSMASES